MNTEYSLGYTIVISFLICIYAGYKLDNHFGSKPWFLLGSVMFAMAFVMYSIYKVYLNDKNKK